MFAKSTIYTYIPTTTMKNKIVSLSFLILSLFACASCQKENIDSRDQYVGTYQMTYTRTSINMKSGASVIQGLSGKMKVEKGSTQNQLLFTNPDTYPIDLTGKIFTVKPYNISVPYNGRSYTLSVSGSGKLGSNSISYETVGTMYVDGTLVEITTKGNGSKQ